MDVVNATQAAVADVVQFTCCPLVLVPTASPAAVSLRSGADCGQSGARPGLPAVIG